MVWVYQLKASTLYEVPLNTFFSIITFDQRRDEHSIAEDPEMIIKTDSCIISLMVSGSIPERVTLLK